MVLSDTAKAAIEFGYNKVKGEGRLNAIHRLCLTECKDFTPVISELRDLLAACGMALVATGGMLQIQLEESMQSARSETLPADPLKGVEHPQLGS